MSWGTSCPLKPALKLDEPGSRTMTPSPVISTSGGRVKGVGRWDDLDDPTDPSFLQRGETAEPSSCVACKLEYCREQEEG